jgi:hypothetical protein
MLSSKSIAVVASNAMMFTSPAKRTRPKRKTGSFDIDTMPIEHKSVLLAAERLPQTRSFHIAFACVSPGYRPLPTVRFLTSISTIIPSARTRVVDYAA